MLQNARFAAFTVSLLLRENRKGDKNTPHTQIRINFIYVHLSLKISVWVLVKKCTKFPKLKKRFTFVAKHTL